MYRVLTPLYLSISQPIIPKPVQVLSHLRSSSSVSFWYGSSASRVVGLACHSTAGYRSSAAPDSTACCRRTRTPSPYPDHLVVTSLP